MKKFLPYLLAIAFTPLLHSQSERIAEFQDDLWDLKVLGIVDNSIIYELSEEIWISDGTPAGNVKLLDAQNDYVISHNKATLNGKYYFMRGLWISNDDNRDMTLYEVDPSGPSIRAVLSNYDGLSALVAYQSELYIGVKNDPTHGNAFVKLFPQISGFSELVFNTSDSWGTSTSDALVHNGLIYTLNRSVSDGMDYLSYTDGTKGNVTEYFRLNAGAPPIATNRSLRVNMTAAGDKFYCWYNADDNNGYGVYVSDGTQNGTKLLKDRFNRNPKFEYSVEKFKDIIYFDDRLYFNGAEWGDDIGHLWTSDGTVNGTVKIEYEADRELRPSHFTEYNGSLYFKGSRDGSEAGIFKVNGTEVDLAFDTNLHQGDSFELGDNLIAHDGKLYFDGYVDGFKGELYSSEGTLESIKKTTCFDFGGSTLWWLHPTEDNFFFFHFPTDKVHLYNYRPKLTSVTEATSQINVFPNPFMNDIRVPEQVESIHIYDLSGKMIYDTKTLNNGYINVSHLTPGSYILHLIQADQTILKKITKF